MKTKTNKLALFLMTSIFLFVLAFLMMPTQTVFAATDDSLDAFGYDCNIEAAGEDADSSGYNAWNISADDDESEVYAYFTTTNNGDTYALNIGGSGDMLDYTSTTTPWGLALTAVGGSYNYGMALISDIVWEDGNKITTIGAYAFQYTGLTEIDFPSNLVNINAYAYRYTTSVSAIVLPDSVKSVGEGAFRFCGASTVDLANVEELGAHSLRNMENLEEITFPSTLTTLSYGALYASGTNGLEIIFDSCTDFTIGSSVTTASNVASITFNNCSNVTLETDAFASSSYLESVVYNNCSDFIMYGNVFNSCTNYLVNSTYEIPACVTYLHGNPASGCLITVADGCTAVYVNDDNDDDSVSEQEYYLYSDSEFKNLILYYGSETNITLPTQIEHIGASAFNANTTLESIELPDGLRIIDASAFYGCTNLREVNFPATVTNVGSSAFYNCMSLETIDLSACTSCTFIYESAFYDCVNLSNVKLPNSLETINSYAFQGCSSLAGIDLKNVTTIGINAFTSSGLTAIIIPNNCYVDKSAFSSCTLLSDVTIGYGATTTTATESNGSPFYMSGGNSIKKVTYYANTFDYKWCVSANSVEELYFIGTETDEETPDIKITGAFPNATIVNLSGVTSIDSSVFCNSSITSVEFSESLKYLGASAFYGTQIESVVIPDNCEINGDTFAMCPNLKSVVVGSGVTYTGTSIASNASPFYGSGNGEGIKYVVFGMSSDELSNDKWFNSITALSAEDSSNSKSLDDYTITSVVLTNATDITITGASSFVDLIVVYTNGGLYESEDFLDDGDVFATPTKEDYIFAGWYEDSLFETAVTANEDSTYTATAGKTYYAKWVSEDFNVTFDSNCEDIDDETVEMTHGDSVTKTMIRTGYTFLGWSTAENGGDLIADDYTVDALNQETLYAQWQADTYTLTYTLEGWVVTASDRTNHTYAGVATTLPVPIKEGYTFDGWYKEADYSDSKITEIESTEITEDIILYAKWIRNISATDISGVSDIYIATESEIYPIPVVVVDGVTLVADTDYTVTYELDNTSNEDGTDYIENGKYVVKVTGTGNYDGVISIDYEIKSEVEASDILGDESAFGSILSDILIEEDADIQDIIDVYSSASEQVIDDISDDTFAVENLTDDEDNTSNATSILIAESILSADYSTLEEKTSGYKLLDTLYTIKLATTEDELNIEAGVKITILFDGNDEATYKVAHLLSDGTIEYLDAEYADGTLSFVVTSCSSFAVVEEIPVVSTSSSRNITISSSYTVSGSSSSSETSTSTETEAEEEVETPATTETPVATETPTATITPVVPEETQADSSNAWIWIVLGVLVVGGIAGFVIYKKKKQ